MRWARPPSEERMLSKDCCKTADGTRDKADGLCAHCPLELAVTDRVVH